MVTGNTDPDAAAVAFKNTFDPQDGVEYGWVVTHAKERYAHMYGAFCNLDDKAASVLTFLGSGTGVLTVGAIAAFAAGKLSPWVVAALMPATVAAVVALGFAVAARRAAAVVVPPGVATAVGYAEYFRERGEAAFLGLWNLALVRMGPVVARKARLVNGAFLGLVVTVALLLLPLGVVIGRHLLGWPP